MRLKNSESRYGFIAILLHWVMTALIMALLVIGLYMVELPLSPQKLKWYAWHKEYGLLVLSLVIVRLCWRVINKTPSLAALAWWERFLARLVHWAFYGFMFALPLSGWFMSSAAGFPPSFFGLFTFPSLIAENKQWLSFLKSVHEALAYALIATIVLHIIAALKHHFIDKDDILRRIVS